MSLRLIYLHMIEEYALHLGHAGFLRERIGGAAGEQRRPITRLPRKSRGRPGSRAAG